MRYIKHTWNTCMYVYIHTFIKHKPWHAWLNLIYGWRVLVKDESTLGQLRRKAKKVTFIVFILLKMFGTRDVTLKVLSQPVI